MSPVTLSISQQNELTVKMEYAEMGIRKFSMHFLLIFECAALQKTLGFCYATARAVVLTVAFHSLFMFVCIYMDLYKWEHKHIYFILTWLQTESKFRFAVGLKKTMTSSKDGRSTVFLWYFVLAFCIFALFVSPTKTSEHTPWFPFSRHVCVIHQGPLNPFCYDLENEMRFFNMAHSDEESIFSNTQLRNLAIPTLFCHRKRPIIYKQPVWNALKRRTFWTVVVFPNQTPLRETRCE